MQYDYSIPVLDHNLIKIVIVQKVAKVLITATWLFWAYLSFVTIIFAAIPDTLISIGSKYISKINNYSNM